MHYLSSAQIPFSRLFYSITMTEKAGSRAIDIGDVKHHEQQLPAIDSSPSERTARLAARATLQNALHGIPKQQLFAEVDQFCDRYDFNEYQAVFRKGALIAQRPKAWDAIEELNAEERAYIEQEHKHRSGHSHLAVSD